MIEQGIYFAIGCIVTALAALMFAPVFWNRALRLTRQRLQLQIPVSMQEIYAERDGLRAEFAVERVRLEHALARVQAGKARDMAEIGRRSVEASRLAEQLAAAGDTAAAQERVIAGLKAEADARQAELATLQASLPGKPGDAPTVSTILAGTPAPAGPAPDDLQRRMRSLEGENEALRASLDAAREREKSAFLQSSLRAERSRSADRLASEQAELLRTENAALRSALDALRSPVGDAADAGLRDSIHALGLAVAAMTREAEDSGEEGRRDRPARDGAAETRADADAH